MQYMEQLLLLMTFISSAILLVYSVVRDHYWGTIVSFAILLFLILFVLVAWIDDLISRKFNRELPNFAFRSIPLIVLLFTALAGILLK